MENGLGSIKIAVGIIILCVVVALAFFITRTGKNQVNQATSQLIDITSEFDEADKLVYDGVTCDGNEVIRTISKFGGSDEVAVKVVHKNEKVEFYTTAERAAIEEAIGTTIEEGATIKADGYTAKDRTDETYINPGAAFKGSVIRNKDNVIVCIVFTQD